MFNIVLIEPEIPQNTGTIARLCAATNSRLILVGKLGFSLSDKYLKRAGLDYWDYVNWTHIESKVSYFKSLDTSSTTPWLLTTKTDKCYFNAPFTGSDTLIFGSESKGLSDNIRSDYSDQLITIPMMNQNIRSLNLANAVSIVLYEAIRQQND